MKKIIAVVITLFLSFTLSAFLELNDIVPAFPEDEQGAIESAVIQGAIHFLQAKSQADLLLGEVELSAKQPLNYSSALVCTEKAIGELEKSINEYHQAITCARRGGYVKEVIKKFKNFNYDTFASESKLNRDVMAVVKAYFSAGNIIGVYQQYVEYLGEILITLHLIKDKLSADLLPDVSLSWQLLQQFSHASLFGNYCTLTATAVFGKQ
ncbi:MAG: hypothetical protein PVH61_04575 [Candidatus Aminicenantes bacterium]|jgi:hypothetical protein